MISGLSAMVILIVWIFELFSLRITPHIYIDTLKQLKPLSAIILGYALFASLVSFIREIVKDIEDVEGDRMSGYKTLPIVWGAKRAKWISLSLTVFCIVLLAIAQYVLFEKNVMLVFWYLMIAVQSLLIFTGYNVLKAETREDYHFLSNALKIIMVAGILSMQLFYISF